MAAPEQAGNSGWRALDRGPCRDRADLSTVRADTFHPASLAAPSYYFTSSWHQHSYVGRQQEEMFYRIAYAAFVLAHFLV